MPDILITEQISGAAIAELGRRFSLTTEPDLWRSPEKLKSAVGSCRALLVRNQTRVTAEIIAAAPRLLVVGRSGAGLDNIDVAAATAAGIVVVSTPDQNSLSVAELTMGMMFALARHLPAADRDTHNGGWNRHRFLGIELYGKTLGLVGLGRIGFMTALRARAMGMRIIAHDQFINPDASAVTESQAELLSLEEVLRRADFVSCHVPLTPETKHLFNYERFAAMKPTAYFLNLARGEVVDENGLIRALDEKRLAGAALDVREEEPPPASALMKMDNVILTPHIAALTREGQERVVNALCADVGRVLAGEPARNCANFSQPKNRRTAAT
ncbi:MAG: hydroxyacid dehydrogenase [Opitutaceae bacterium]|nr:hydroxyacid dehydrogenase [Opitutaceae bacterium]